MGFLGRLGAEWSVQEASSMERPSKRTGQKVGPTLSVGVQGQASWRFEETKQNPSSRKTGQGHG